MTEYERQRNEREKRINIMRISRALFEAIGGSFSGSESPNVQHLARLLHYMPEQMLTDAKDLYQTATESSGFGELLDRITARQNTERAESGLDEISTGEVLQIIISDYALRHCPELMHEPENDF